MTRECDYSEIMIHTKEHEAVETCRRLIAGGVDAHVTPRYSVDVSFENKAKAYGILFAVTETTAPETQKET